MLTIHHLGRSQSERIIWLCEELGLPYDLKIYDRDAKTILAPPELAALHPMGAAPVITEGSLLLAESGAIVDYILAKYGKGRLTVAPDAPGFAEYLYWFHFANGNLQPVMGRSMILRRLKLPSDNPIQVAMQGRLERVLHLLEQHLSSHEYLAGPFTAADIMSVFPLRRCACSCPWTSPLTRPSAPTSPASAPARRISVRWKRAILASLRC